MAMGAQYMPRAATVAYAAAMDSGETLTEPRVNEGMLSAESCPPSLLNKDVPSALVIPMLAAVLTTLHRPTFCSSSAKKVFTDWTVPVYRDCLESDPGPSAFVTLNAPAWPW